MHRKRVTSELHDSYFRLMTIKHSISKIQWAIVWALNYYIIEWSWVPKQLPADSQALGKPPKELTPASAEQERHNVTVITVGSKYEVYVRSLAPPHMQNLEQPFRTLAIKREVNIFVKKSSCVFLHASFIPASFCVRLSLLLSRYDTANEYIYVYFCMNQQMTMQHMNPSNIDGLESPLIYQILLPITLVNINRKILPDPKVFTDNYLQHDIHRYKSWN